MLFYACRNNDKKEGAGAGGGGKAGMVSHCDTSTREMFSFACSWDTSYIDSLFCKSRV